MELQDEEVGNVTVIHVKGNILQENVLAFRTNAFDLINAGRANIVLDMENSDYLNSTCLAAIIKIKKKAAALGGDLKLAHLNRHVHNLLESTFLIMKFEIFRDVTDAVESFASSRP
jgi:anti-anti-sigma factor